MFGQRPGGAQLAGPRHKLSLVDASANVGPWIREQKLNVILQMALEKAPDAVERVVQA